MAHLGGGPPREGGQHVGLTAIVRSLLEVPGAIWRYPGSMSLDEPPADPATLPETAAAATKASALAPRNRDRRVRGRRRRDRLACATAGRRVRAGTFVEVDGGDHEKLPGMWKWARKDI